MGSKKTVGSKKIEVEEVRSRNFIFFISSGSSGRGSCISLAFVHIALEFIRFSNSSRFSLSQERPHVDVRGSIFDFHQFLFRVCSVYCVQARRLQKLDSKGVTAGYNEGLRKEKENKERTKLEFRDAAFPRQFQIYCLKRLYRSSYVFLLLFVPVK